MNCLWRKDAWPDEIRDPSELKPEDVKLALRRKRHGVGHGSDRFAPG